MSKLANVSYLDNITVTATDLLSKPDVTKVSRKH